MPGLSPEDQELVNAALSKYTAAVPPPVAPVQELAGQALAQPAPVAPTDQAMAMAALNRNSVPPEPMAPTPAPMVAPTAVAPVAPAAPAVAVSPRPHGKQTFQGALGELDDATATAEQAQQTYTNAQVEGLHAREKLAGEQAAQQQEFATQQAERQKMFQENSARIQAEHDELQAKADSMQIKDSRSTGMKAMAIVGQAFAGLGDGFARLGGNTDTNYAGNAIRMTHEAVEADLSRQREAKKSAGETAEKKLNELGLARDFFNDDTKAAEWFKANRQELYATQLEQAAAASGSQVKTAEGQKAAAELRLSAQQKKTSLIGQHEEQQMRSRLLGGAKAGGGAAMGVQDILRMGDTNVPMTPKQRAEYNQLDKTRDAETRAKDQAAARAAGGGDKSTRAQLEALESTGDITVKQQTALDTLRRGQAKDAAPPKLTESQGKAQALFTGAKAARDSIKAAIDSGYVPSYGTASSTMGAVPDALISKADSKGLKVVKDAQRIVLDVLRDESGAAISKTEKDELLNDLKSTDETTRRDALQRIYAKVEAMGSKFPQAAPKATPASVQPKTTQRATSAADFD